MKFSLLIVALIFAACSSTRITHTWKASDQPVRNYQKILVVALDGQRDVNAREAMEKHMAGDLNELGYHAVSSTVEYGPKEFAGLEEAEVLDKLKNSGVDAVITIVLLDKSRERYYVPGRIYFSPYVVYHRRFFGYYSTIHSRIYEPGYYSSNTRYFWESNLYDLQSRELLFSVQTESFDSNVTGSLAHEYGKLIVQDMVKEHVLTSQRAVKKS